MKGSRWKESRPASSRITPVPHRATGRFPAWSWSTAAAAPRSPSGPRFGPTGATRPSPWIWAVAGRAENAVAAALHYTSDTGPWKERKWESVEARLADATVSAELPAGRPLVYYLSVTDQRGAMTSTEHAELR